MSGKTWFVTVGSNPARAFGMAADDRARALAAKAGLEPVAEAPAGEGAVYGNLGFGWDPAWLSSIAKTPDSVLVKDGRPVLAHIAAGGDAATVIAAMEQGLALEGSSLERIDADTAELAYDELRKRERPFVVPLDPANPEAVERAAYDASYKGVTDALTLYLWRKPAFYLTRWAARAGMTPNQVTLIGFLFCLAAFFLFWHGWYWTGVATGFLFMVLDTVDGKLARCTGQSSKWGEVFDHGVDLIHPPFWWWAWVHGLAAVGLALEPVLALLVLGIIVGGYVLQRLIEGAFIYRHKMHIHVWQKIDSQFRLITARRNPNMVILVACLAAGRPDLGIELVAAWTLISLIFHWVRLVQANARSDRGQAIASWLA